LHQSNAEKKKKNISLKISSNPNKQGIVYENFGKKGIQSRETFVSLHLSIELLSVSEMFLGIFCNSLAF
jgi:hypothetical protein